MREYTIPTNFGEHIQDISLDYFEFVRRSARSTTGRQEREYYNRGGFAGAGFVFGTIVFTPQSVDLPVQRKAPPYDIISVRPDADRTAIDEFMKNMSSESRGFVWTKLPFRYTLASTPTVGVRRAVRSQENNPEGDLVTTIDAWPELQEGMWVNVGAVPLKTRYVTAKLSSSQFIFHPQDLMPTNIIIQPASEIWIQKNDYNIRQQPKITRSTNSILPSIAFDFVEVTTEVR